MFKIGHYGEYIMYFVLRWGWESIVLSLDILYRGDRLVKRDNII